ncbi:hypothetical protein [Sulfurospirillum arsenophilum]|uniref:hypothetical protein n=1 Tax=Sulfurospirillum arsenophilum TaxID=56698 RepID=UPI0005A680AB|nr:hypothetical protein [Sulfurospirillum arsenophilum]
MNKKKWVKIWFCFFILIPIIGLLNYIIDPFGVHSGMKFVFNKHKFMSNEFTVPRYMEYLKKNRSMIVFGSSRSLCFTPEVLNFKNVINPNHVYGNPHCVYNFLNQLDEQQLNNIKEIYYNISYHVLNKYSHCHITDYNNMDDWEKLLKLITKKTTLCSIETVSKNVFEEDLQFMVNENGTTTDTRGTYFSPTKINTRIFEANIKREKELLSVTSDTLISLKKIDDFCRQRNIKITYFTDALTDYKVAMFDIEKLKLFHMQLLTVIDSFYALNYIENFSNDYTLFTDDNHIHAKSAQYIFENILKNNDSFYHVSKKNIDSYLKYLEDSHANAVSSVMQKYFE